MQVHQEELYDYLEDISAGLARGLADGKEKTPYSFRFALDNKTWTKGDNVSFVMSQLNFGLLTLIADGFAGSMRQKEMAGKTSKILKSIYQQYHGVRESVRKMIEDTYSDMEKLAKTQLQSYYSDKIETAQAEVDQCIMVANQNETNKFKVEIVIKEIRDTLSRIGINRS